MYTENGPGLTAVTGFRSLKNVGWSMDFWGHSVTNYCGLVPFFEYNNGTYPGGGSFNIGRTEQQIIDAGGCGFDECVPTLAPSGAPTESSFPTITAIPSGAPTETAHPSITSVPTKTPSTSPITPNPSISPTKQPTNAPSKSPSESPVTDSPTAVVSLICNCQFLCMKKTTKLMYNFCFHLLPMVAIQLTIYRTPNQCTNGSRSNA